MARGSPAASGSTAAEPWGGPQSLIPAPGAASRASGGPKDAGKGARKFLLSLSVTQPEVKKGGVGVKEREKFLLLIGLLISVKGGGEGVREGG